MSLQQDLKDLLAEFAAADVKYLIVGGYAVSVYTEPRFTKDLDLWLLDTPDNLAKASVALDGFGAPDDVKRALFSALPSDVVWMGRPPARIDLLKGVPGEIPFADAYQRRIERSWDGVPVSIVGRDDLIALKRASGRPIDLLDAATLAELEE